MKKLLSLLLCAACVVASLTACQSSGKKTSKGYATQINFFQWTEYTPKSVLNDFKKKYGITVKMTMYSSNEQMIAKLKAGGLKQYDVTVPSSYSVISCIKQNLIEPFDKKYVPNLKNIDKSCLNRDFDPNNTYTVPYMLPPCVLVVNTKKVKKNITSFNDLLDSSLKNSIVSVDDERSLMAVALKSLGYSCNDVNPAHLKKVLAWLDKIKPNIKQFDSDSPKTSLISGECTVGFVWNGEAALALKANKDLKVVWPKEGICGLIFDNLALVKGTQHKREAELFMNFILDPKESAKITAVYPYTNPNAAAHKYLGSSYNDNQAINIPWAQIKKSELLGNVGSSITEYDKIWSEFKS